MDIKSILTKALHKRVALKPSTNALRLVNGVGDGLKGLSLDQYNQHFVIQVFDSKAFAYVPAVTQYISENLNPAFLVVKDRTSSDGRSLDKPKIEVLVNRGESKTVVTENSLKFGIDVIDTINAGLFLDMRHNRKQIGELANNKRVLNCFAYTCSFGVYAKMGGAKEVINVDISKKGLDKGRENYRVNALVFTDKEFIRTNCYHYLLHAAEKDNQFDIIILDPPSFARYDHKVFHVVKELPKLIMTALKILNNKGFMHITTNYAQYSTVQLMNDIRTYLRASGRSSRALIPLTQDRDFPGEGLMKESHLAGVLLQLN